MNIGGEPTGLTLVDGILIRSAYGDCRNFLIVGPCCPLVTRDIVDAALSQAIPMTPELQQRIESLLQDNKIVVFMKGNKLMPQCGFSNNVVQIINMLGVPYETVDVLEDYEIRQGIKEFSNWPTIPQVYINGEFIGGSDIMIELYQKGELQQMVEIALAS